MAPRISLGIVLRKSTSTLEACMADVMMISEHSAYARMESGSVIYIKLDRTTARQRNDAGTVMWAPILSEMCPTRGRAKAVPNKAINVIFW